MERAVEAGALWSRWEEAVGATIAEHAEPTSLRRGVLKVRTDSPAWATEIGYMQEQIVAAANQLLGGRVVTEVQVWTSPGPIRRRHSAAVPETDARGSSDVVDGPPTDDPVEALERARAAWFRRRSGRARRGPSKASGKQENPW